MLHLGNLLNPSAPHSALTGIREPPQVHGLFARCLQWPRRAFAAQAGHARRRAGFRVPSRQDISSAFVPITSQRRRIPWTPAAAAPESQQPERSAVSHMCGARFQSIVPTLPKKLLRQAPVQFFESAAMRLEIVERRQVIWRLAEPSRSGGHGFAVLVIVRRRRGVWRWCFRREIYLKLHVRV